MKEEHKRLAWSCLNTWEQRVKVIGEDNESDALMDGLSLVLSAYSPVTM